MEKVCPFVDPLSGRQPKQNPDYEEGAMPLLASVLNGDA
jgi:hypothetical protein